MREDPLVTEARQVGQEYVNSFKGDWRAMIADLHRRSEREGRQTVSLRPKQLIPGPAPVKHRD